MESFSSHKKVDEILENSANNYTPADFSAEGVQLRLNGGASFCAFEFRLYPHPSDLDQVRARTRTYTHAQRAHTSTKESRTPASVGPRTPMAQTQTRVLHLPTHTYTRVC